MKVSRPQKKILLTLGAILVSFIISITLLPVSELNSKVQLGNILLGQESEQKILALNQYQTALKQWPFLRFNLGFQEKIQRAKVELEKYKNNRAAIIIFLKANASGSDISSLIKGIESMGGVRETRFVSVEKALEIYKEKYNTNPEILELITSDILPASIEVFLVDWSLRTKIKELAEVKPFVSEVVITLDIDRVEKDIFTLPW